MKFSTVLPRCFLAAAAASALLVIAAPPLPWWGDRHLPHLHKPPLLLSSGHTVGQTFRAEGDTLDHVALWLDTERSLPAEGDIVLEVETAGQQRASRLGLADIPPSGVAIFRLDPPLRASRGTEGTLRVHLERAAQQIGLRYQLDPSKYQEGSIVFGTAQGDLAFQVRYQRPALGSTALQRLFALALLAAGSIAAALLRARPQGAALRSLTRRDVRRALALGIAASVLYGIGLLRPGIWVGATDFSKDAAYLSSSADALRAGAWPTWSHRTCGGMALLGNPEGNTLSLGTLLATVLPPDRALLLLLALEAGSAATGTFLLARALGSSAAGGAAAALVASLAAPYAYKIVEGLTPVGGAVAFLPWVFLGLVRALESGSGWWALVSGTALAGMLHRGDVHVIVGAIALIALWSILASLQGRTARPLGILVGIGAVTFLWGSIKVLPYLEQPALIQEALPPYVAPLARFGILDDALLRIHDRGEHQLRPLHGRRFEQWGNFGSTVGVLPLILAGVGALTPGRYRLTLAAAAALAFLISEGTLFEVLLRRNEILGSLLRIPTRVMVAFTLFLGLLAGIGLDRIVRDAPRRARALVSAALLLALAAELVYATGRVLLANTEWNTEPPHLRPSGPTLTTHANVSPDHERHPTKLNRAGFLLTRICGDQNNPPAFVRTLAGQQPLASVPTTIAPNRIRLEVPRGPADVSVRERFTTSWRTARGALLEHDDGGVHLVLPRGSPQSVDLSYGSPTAPAQKLLLALLAGTVVAGLIRTARSWRTLPS